MQRRELDLVIVFRAEHVQWLTGWRPAWVFSACAALSIEGQLTLVAPNAAPDNAAADDVITYHAQWLCTLRNDQPAACATALLDAFKTRLRPRRVGIEYSACFHGLTRLLANHFIDIEPELYRLRRRKDHDELAMIRQAIAGTGAMYARAREIIRPGINELEVFSELQAAVVREFGEINPSLGNDWACGEPGGPPRNRAAHDGELYILDLGPQYRGYFADNCRTIAVSGEPSAPQRQAWEHIVKIFDHVQQNVRPGKSCRELFDEVKSQLAQAAPWEFNHHLGHGIGLFPHETPHLNPNWDDRFEVGDVFACEPGLYGPDLRAGIRLENNYLLTESGVELLSDFPLSL